MKYIRTAKSEYSLLIYQKQKPLFWAMGSKKASLVSLMITSSDTINRQVRHANGMWMCPLNRAISRSNFNVLKLLLESGADPQRVVCGAVPYTGLDSWRTVLLLRRRGIYKERDTHQLHYADIKGCLVYVSLLLTTAVYNVNYEHFRVSGMYALMRKRSRRQFSVFDVK